MKPDNKFANCSNPESEGNYFNLFVEKKQLIIQSFFMLSILNQFVKNYYFFD